MVARCLTAVIMLDVSKLGGALLVLWQEVKVYKKRNEVVVGVQEGRKTLILKYLYEILLKLYRCEVYLMSYTVLS